MRHSYLGEGSYGVVIAADDKTDKDTKVSYRLLHSLISPPSQHACIMPKKLVSTVYNMDNEQCLDVVLLLRVTGCLMLLMDEVGAGLFGCRSPSRV